MKEGVCTVHEAEYNGMTRQKGIYQNTAVDFPALFKKYITCESLVKRGETILVAFSGGIDSAVLCHVFHSIREEFNLTLILGYFNHGLRGSESMREEAFIVKTARNYGLPLETGTGAVKKTAAERKLSLQEAARLLRYDFLAETAKRHSADKIATGHHMDDQIETVLMRFLQGNGYRGLRGIPYRRGQFIRPLLWARRSAIASYARRQSIQYFEDSSNEKTNYLRNRIRHEILPFLREKLNINIDSVLLQHGKRFQEYGEIVDYLTKNHLKSSIIKHEKNKIILDITNFNNYFTSLKQNILCECFNELGEIDTSRYNDYSRRIIDLIQETFVRKEMYIGNDLYVRLHDNQLIICRVHEVDFEVEVELGKTYIFEEQNFSFRSTVTAMNPDKNVLKEKRINNFQWDEIIDTGLLEKPLILRFWEKGDTFTPLGLCHRKKLSDLFTDMKIPWEDKRRFPLLVDKEKIVWVCGIRIDDRVKVTENTHEVACLKYNRLDR